MKRFAVILLLGCTVLFSNGQMMFNNIPLGVPYHNFKLELQKKGYAVRATAGSKDENTFLYTGEFIGKNANIAVLVTPITKTVWKVDVELPGFDSWAGIKAEYLDLCKKLTQKYGAPTKKFTNFSNPYAEGDGKELIAIYEDKCLYLYNWKTDNGQVSIEMISHTPGTALINICYEDKTAGALNTSEKDKMIIDGL